MESSCPYVRLSFLPSLLQSLLQVVQFFQQLIPILKELLMHLVGHKTKMLNPVYKGIVSYASSASPISREWQHHTQACVHMCVSVHSMRNFRIRKTPFRPLRPEKTTIKTLPKSFSFLLVNWFFVKICLCHFWLSVHSPSVVKTLHLLAVHVQSHSVCGWHPYRHELRFCCPPTHHQSSFSPHCYPVSTTDFKQNSADLACHQFTLPDFNCFLILSLISCWSSNSLHMSYSKPGLTPSFWSHPCLLFWGGQLLFSFKQQKLSTIYTTQYF